MPADPNLLQLPTRIKFDKATIESANLCGRFAKDELDTLGNWVYDGYYRDRMSRSKWEKRTRAAMDLAMQVQKQKSFPWPGCSSVAFPLITIGALQFSANSYSNIIQGDEIVRYRLAADDKTGQLTKRADRIARHMSWQVMEQDQAWEEQHDRLLINLSIVGTAFIKSYYNPNLGYPVGELVTAQDLVVNYYARSLETASRKTQRLSLYRNEIYERIARGTFRDVRDEAWYRSAPVLTDESAAQDNRSGVSPVQPDADAPFSMLEQHRFLDLDHDGYAEPYIVTIEEQSKCVVRLVARVDDENSVYRGDGGRVLYIRPSEYFTKYPFIANPDGGFYDLGFGTLLGPLNESVSTIVNQLIDNGTLHCMQGGFLGRGFSIRGGNYTVKPFEFKRVDSTGDDIRKNLVLFDVKDPPQILFQLLGLLIEYSQRISGTTDVMVGENPGQNTPASTYQGLKETGMQVYSWIFKRIWRAMKGEFKQRYELNRRFLPAHLHFGEQQGLIYNEDYHGNSDLIAPVADPNLPSTMMRLQQALFVAQRAQVVPGYDHDMVEKQVLRAARVQNPSLLYPGMGSPKAKALPNPKLEVEQAKLQGIQLKLKQDQQEWANKLMEEKRLNDAKILSLQAGAYAAIKGAQGAQAAAQLEQFEKVLQILGDHSAALTKQISELSNGNQSGSQRDGMGGMAGASGNTSLAGDAGAAQGGDKGTVGAGDLAPPSGSNGSGGGD
jgi:chaperonin GroES